MAKYMRLKPGLDDLIKSSFRSILKNKGRTILTSLGIIIGVTSVILLTSIGNGLKSYINDQFEKLGSNLIFVAPGRIFNDNGGFNNSAGLVTLSFDQNDIGTLKKALKGQIVFPAKQIPIEVKYGKTKKSVNLIGTTYEFAKYRNFLPSSNQGRWFTDEENDKKSNVVVLANKIAQDLFGSRNPLGKKIIVGGKNLKVIGVVDKKGSTFGGPDLDSYIFVPIKTSFKIAGDEKIQSINIKINNGSQIDQFKKKITDTMLKRYDKDTFSVFDSSQLLSSINSIIGTLTVALTGIAAISLVVGGIGIMNIMLVTVSERTKEIGLRKALGAYPRAILIQFLIEAVTLSALGGAFGVLLGFAGSLLINRFFPAQVTLSSVLLAFGVSSAVGIIFGVTPARKASKLSPIEALRYE
jgi:putative ABC transport system permease protein